MLRTVTGVVVEPLGVEDVVHGDNVVVLREDTRADTAELLHVGTDTEEHTEMDTVSLAKCCAHFSAISPKGTDVGSGLTLDGEDGKTPLLVKVEELVAVDGTDTELTLDGRDKRGALEEGAGEGLEALDDIVLLNSSVEAGNGDVGLSGTLLGLDETGSAVEADNKTSSNLGVEGSRTTESVSQSLMSEIRCATKLRTQSSGP